MHTAGNLAKRNSDTRRERMQILGLIEVKWKDDGYFTSDRVRVINKDCTSTMERRSDTNVFCSKE